MININVGKPFYSTGIPLPPGKYKFLEHDDLAKDFKGQRLRAPEVWPLHWVEYTTLTEAWQRYWFRVGLVHPYTGYKHWDENLLAPWELERLEAEWRSLTHQAKAFTNNFGTDNCKDYISGDLDRAGLPQQGAIMCCGNVFRVMGGLTSRGFPILTLDGTKPPPSIELVNRLTRPDLIFCAVNIPGEKIDGVEYPLIIENGINKGRVKADPFPNLADIPTSLNIDSCVPLRSNGNKVEETFTDNDGIHYAINYIKGGTTRIKDFHGTEVPTPYIQ